MNKNFTNSKLFKKAQTDIYYKDCLSYFNSQKELLEAGFFDDGINTANFEYNIDLFTTPVEKIINNIDKIKNLDKQLMVIVSTGSYSPIHNGHINLMETAKLFLSEKYNIVGGYLSPSHDSYVSIKDGGKAKFNSENRIMLCEECVSQSDWLMIDPWEARYNSKAINFSDVLIRLEKYLAQHIKTSNHILIAYAFGSDNSEFTFAFLKKGVSFCLEREGFEEKFLKTKTKYQKFIPVCNFKNYFIEKKHNLNYNHISSEKIRLEQNLEENNNNDIPKTIKEKYLFYKKFNFYYQYKKYLLRDDKVYATQNFIDKFKKNNGLITFNKNLNIFHSSLEQNLQNSFVKYSDIQIVSINTEQQKQFLKNFTQKIINIDSCTSNSNYENCINHKNKCKQFKIGVSRLFNLSDGQVFSEKLINRPGTNSLSTQIAKIPDGKYLLIDDDIVSGKTIEFIQQKLKIQNNRKILIEDVKALSVLSFENIFGKNTDYQIHDIIDFKDFLIGSADGGLVVKLPNHKIGRAPYILPYVSLTFRAKLPPCEQLLFSLKMWEINKIFFDHNKKIHNLKIKDMDKYFINTALYLGFNKTDSMSFFCEFHINKIKKYII